MSRSLAQANTLFALSAELHQSITDEKESLPWSEARELEVKMRATIARLQGCRKLIDIKE
jgi:hypothetical protein